MNKKRIKLCLISIISLFLILFVIYNILNFNYIELTQLHDNSTTQMMGYFIKTDNGKIVVIDGGTTEDSENLQKYINNNGGKVDYWILTHYHADHTGAIADIINNTEIIINNIIYKECSVDMVSKYESARMSQYEQIHNALQNEKVKDKIITPTSGEIFDLDEKTNIKIIDVYEYDIVDNFGNNTSTVFKINVNNKSLLFLGDIGTERSDKLLNNNYEQIKSDYVQMSHHGQNGATFDLYKAIDPTYCLWPTPAWLWDNIGEDGYNTGPYKTIETREWMNQLNVKENYIEKDGDITLKIK